MKPLFILLIFTVSFSISVNSQGSSDSQSQELTTWQMLKHDGGSIYGGIKNVYTRPFKWKGKDWATFGGLIGGTALLYLIDEPANDFFTDQEDDIPQFVKDFGFRFGKPQINYGLTASIYSFGLLTKNEKIRKTGVLLIASAAAEGVMLSIGRTLIGRARPNRGKGKDSFMFYSTAADYHSFPSGHSILSFTTAYAIAKQFKNPYIKGGLYAIGLVSPVSRLWAGAHWLTDITFGIALSIIIVDGIDNYLTRNNRYTYSDPNKFRVKWNLTIGAGQFGVLGRF